MQDGASSLPLSYEDPAAELPGTQETDNGAGAWVRKLRDALDGVELDLQGLDLDEIEPGLLSDQVRKALDDEYVARLPPLARRQSVQRTGASQTRVQGRPRVRHRAQYAQVQREYWKNRSCCVQNAISHVLFFRVDHFL